MKKAPREGGPSRPALALAHDPDASGRFRGKMGVGWPAVQTEFTANKANVAAISVKPLTMHVRINGGTAWVFRTEERAALPKVGASSPGSNFVTNISKKNEDSRWLSPITASVSGNNGSSLHR
jgi:hypothetical protein